MKTTLFFVWAVLVLTAAAFAQPNPDTLWTRTYGVDGIDEAHSIQQTVDGGFVIAGWASFSGAGTYDFYVVKTNPQGDTLWTQTYGGSGDDKAWSDQQTDDGGFVIAGETTSFGSGNDDFYVVKTNSQGDTLWTRTYGGSVNEGASSVQQTSDDGFVVAGYTNSFGAGGFDFYVVKANNQGDTLWTRTYGGYSDDCAWSVQQTADGGFVIAGETTSFGAGGDDFYVVKTDEHGDTLWTRTYGGNDSDVAYSIQQTSDGGFVVAGYTWSYGIGNWTDVYVVKINSLGDTLWTRTYGGSGWDDAYSIQQTADSGFVVAGSTNSFGVGGDFYVVKTNNHGDTHWSRTYGGSGIDVAASIQQTSDNGYVVAGWTTSFGFGFAEFYVVKTGPDVLAADPPRIVLPSAFILSCSPNPFNPSTQIAYALPKAGRVSLTVSNLLGQHVATLMNGMQTGGSHTISFDGSTLPTGVYLYRLQAGEYSQTKKMVLLK